MLLRPFRPEDYEMVCGWWDMWDWPNIPLESLPQTGFIVENEGVETYAAFLYRTDSDICWLEWFVGNKKASKKQREGCLEFLLEKSADFAREAGFKKIFCSVMNSSLMAKMEKVGFVKTETNMTNYIGVL